MDSSNASHSDRSPDRDIVAAEIAGFIREGGDGGPERLDSIARRLFAYQYANNIPYRRFCAGRGASPETITSWRDIPAAPAVAFKRFPLTCALESECEWINAGRTFHSSGTTGAETSRHFLDRAALNLYRLSLREGWNRFVNPDQVVAPIYALMPHPSYATHSSLSFMAWELIRETQGNFLTDSGWQWRLAKLLQAQEQPVILFGTAFAWVHYFDTVTEDITLPEGSRLLETGGFKGKSREVSRDELYGLFVERLGVPPSHCLSEYGMSEMASQFYDSTLVDHLNGAVRPMRKIGPPWLKTRIMDPVTGTDAAPGTPGLLAHYDLANLNSVMAIQTEDMGIAADDGEGFHLLGRAPGAVLRGCSLTAEEVMLTSVDPRQPDA